LRVHITTTLTPELRLKAEQNNIQMSEALRVGIGVILAERGLEEYDGMLNLYRKMQKYKDMTQEMSNKLNLMNIN